MTSKRNLEREIEKLSKTTEQRRGLRQKIPPKEELEELEELLDADYSYLDEFRDEE